MNYKDIKTYMLNPLHLIKTIYYSFRLSPKNFYRLPIRTTWNGKIKCHSNGNIILNGVLNLGMTNTQVSDMGRISQSCPLIHIDTGGVLDLKGRFSMYSGSRIMVSKDASLIIENNTYISFNSLIISKQLIEIGEDCAISWDVNIIDSDFHEITISGTRKDMTKPIKIGNRVWIGSKASILKGVSIGDDSIVAAGSIVTRDVPPKTLVAGNPARIVKENVCWK